MASEKKIKLSRTTHKQKSIIRIDFTYDVELIRLVKDQPGARWSQTMKSWYIPEKLFDLRRFFESFREMAWVDYSGLKKKNVEQPPQKTLTVKPRYNLKAIKAQLSPTVRTEIQSFKKWMEQKRYAENTIKTYIHQLEIFFFFLVLCFQNSGDDQ